MLFELNTKNGNNLTTTPFCICKRDYGSREDNRLETCLYIQCLFFTLVSCLFVCLLIDWWIKSVRANQIEDISFWRKGWLICPVESFVVIWTNDCFKMLVKLGERYINTIQFNILKHTGHTNLCKVKTNTQTVI